MQSDALFAAMGLHIPMIFRGYNFFLTMQNSRLHGSERQRNFMLGAAFNIRENAFRQCQNFCFAIGAIENEPEFLIVIFPDSDMQ